MKKDKKPGVSNDPLEVKLVFEVKACRTCTFFWPDKEPQPYGPYPTYDFEVNYPKEEKPKVANAFSYPWIKGVTNEPGFPDPEVVDGCRKAPIMTIGINPNLTAFLPGQTGASWVYPSFSNTKNSDNFIKYAWYYRYRSTYQEHLDFEFIKTQLLKPGQVKAKADGHVTAAGAPTDATVIDLEVKYDASQKTEKIPLRWKAGQPRYVLLNNISGPESEFKKGDTIAAKLTVPAGKKLNIDRQQIGYYEQFVPVLKEFNTFLQGKGHKKANLVIGEDVCQLDMVACASPHWGSGFLGGSDESVNTIINNCVSKNAWAVKQLLQTNPAVLYIVGEASYDMFYGAFHSWIKSSVNFPKKPEDGAFTLLRMTTDPKTPFYIEFNYASGGHTYKMKTRLVVSPHFSYNTNFLPQFRLSPADMASFKKKFGPCYSFLTQHPGITIVPPEDKEGFTAFELVKDAPDVFNELKLHYVDAFKVLNTYYYSAHTMMNDVLEDLYKKGTLSWTNDHTGGYISRNSGSCHFCVNDHWKFPKGCLYGKTNETPPPAGFLEKAAAAFVKGHK